MYMPTWCYPTTVPRLGADNALALHCLCTATEP